MKTADAIFLVCVCAVTALFVFATVTRTESASPAAPVPAAAGGGGRPRDVDINRIHKMIERGELSGREAEFYREAPAETSNDQNDTKD